jgi:hypothetical protein
MGEFLSTAGGYSDVLQHMVDDLNQGAKQLANMRHMAFDIDWLISQQKTQCPLSRKKSPPPWFASLLVTGSWRCLSHDKLDIERISD